MKPTAKRQRWWLLILVGSIIPLLLLLGYQFHIPERFTIPLVVLVILILGTMTLWMRANAKASGEEWWQDDSSSGWRGY